MISVFLSVGAADSLIGLEIKGICCCLDDSRWICCNVRCPDMRSERWEV